MAFFSIFSSSSCIVFLRGVRASPHDAFYSSSYIRVWTGLAFVVHCWLLTALLYLYNVLIFDGLWAILIAEYDDYKSYMGPVVG